MARSYVSHASDSYNEALILQALHEEELIQSFLLVFYVVLFLPYRGLYSSCMHVLEMMNTKLKLAHIEVPI